MKAYIALLRGINVGGKNKLKMPDLISTMEKLGFVNIKTYIQSGNITFNSTETDTEKLAASIESHLFRLLRAKCGCFYL